MKGFMSSLRQGSNANSDIEFAQDDEKTRELRAGGNDSSDEETDDEESRGMDDEKFETRFRLIPKNPIQSKLCKQFNFQTFFLTVSIALLGANMGAMLFAFFLNRLEVVSFAMTSRASLPNLNPHVVGYMDITCDMWGARAKFKSVRNSSVLFREKWVWQCGEASILYINNDTCGHISNTSKILCWQDPGKLAIDTDWASNIWQMGLSFSCIFSLLIIGIILKGWYEYVTYLVAILGITQFIAWVVWESIQSCGNVVVVELVEPKINYTIGAGEKIPTTVAGSQIAVGLGAIAAAVAVFLAVVDFLCCRDARHDATKAAAGGFKHSRAGELCSQWCPNAYNYCCV